MEKFIYLMCTLFENFYLLTWGPHMVYHGDPIYILYLYDQMWLVGLRSADLIFEASEVLRRQNINFHKLWTN